MDVHRLGLTSCPHQGNQVNQVIQEERNYSRFSRKADHTGSLRRKINVRFQHVRPGAAIES